MENVTRILSFCTGLVLSGCAFGAGAGFGVSMDTRGTVSVLASGNVMPWGLRAKDVGDKSEFAGHLMPMELSAGVTLNPGGWIIRVDMPGVGFSGEDLDSEHGFSTSLHLRAQISWPFCGGEAKDAWGGILHAAYLKHLDSSTTQPPASRPEWREGHSFHGIGPGLGVAILADDDGWLADFTLSAQYLYITYFTIGL
jgi:hypothetical protein